MLLLESFRSRQALPPSNNAPAPVNVNARLPSPLPAQASNSPPFLLPSSSLADPMAISTPTARHHQEPLAAQVEKALMGLTSPQIDEVCAQIAQYLTPLPQVGLRDVCVWEG
jgi:hypothetical protein